MSTFEDARAAIRYVKVTAKVQSTNHPVDLAAHKSADVAESALQLKADMATKVRTASIKDHDKMSHHVAASALAASKFQIGNCEAQAALAYAYIVENTSSTVQLIAIRGYDHSFLVLGKTRGNYMDPTGWNDDALICDPWANDIYPVPQLLEKMKQLFKETDGAGGIEEDEGKIMTTCQLDSTDSEDNLPFRITPGTA